MSTLGTPGTIYLKKKTRSLAQVVKDCYAAYEALDVERVLTFYLDALRWCGAAVIIVAETDFVKDRVGELSLAENVVMEISAALALHNRQVVLLWESSAPALAKLRGICRCEFAGPELAWRTGVELVRTVKAFEL